MTDKKLILLLHIVNSNGNINQLIRENITFKEIAVLTENAVNQGFLVYENEKVILTSIGIDYLSTQLPQIKKKNKEDWIEKDFKNKIPKLDKNLLFLPRQDELNF